MRTPLKGRPFSKWSDEKLKNYITMFQEFNFAYSGESKERKKLVQEVLKDLQDEKIERATEDFLASSEKKFSPKNGLKSGVSGTSQKKVLKKIKKSVDKLKKA